MSRELLASAAGTRAAGPATPRARAALRRRLLAWYRRHRRPMPWRGIRDPYRIWVSEVMLQQTQVATARPFYQRFIARFPTLRALSRATEAAVLASWAGLGYYRRARNLREAARIVVREHAGRLPDDPGAFGQLPGAGRYTTGAVLSIAFDRSLPALDGNVARVLSRLFALRAAIREPRGAKALWAIAEALVPARGAGDWNQAIMELGAVVCLPRTPRCDACPVRGQCRARALGRVDEFPPVPVRRATERRRRAVALIERGGRMLVVRRSGPLLEGLWEPPGVDLEPGVRARHALAAELARHGVRARLEPTGHVLRHTITHRAIEVEVWRAHPIGAPPRAPRRRYVDAGTRRVALTALARKLAALAGSL
jgi:A/G-specific adenine glycosylase